MEGREGVAGNRVRAGGCLVQLSGLRGRAVVRLASSGGRGAWECVVVCGAC
uniref:Uncharacterized protein n=1 Tax=Human herpesvirus 2 TaxID=10310 RepID=A0A481TXE4_HHV2|nr:hypothetical protein [Human alphaherpesvirus 2]QBH85407.1 hypothetical protein [Human alphaherpesvirus 2]